MMRSMSSAVSSLRAHQMRMDVIGNNIANVNTHGYKGSRVTFKETYAQTVRGGGSAQNGKGGTNPMQIGLGADVASIDMKMTNGAPDRTDNPNDLMINGAGFFILSDDERGLNKSYTRTGNFKLDAMGNLVNTDGFKAMGYLADEAGNIGTTLKPVKIDLSTVYPPQATKRAATGSDEDLVLFNGNLSSDTKTSQNIIADSGGKFTDWEFMPITGGTTMSIYKKLTTQETGGKLIYSPNEQGGKESIGRETTVKVYDDFGNMHEVKLVFTKENVDVTDPTNPVSIWRVNAFYMDKEGNMIPTGASKAIDGAGTPPDKVPNADANGFSYVGDADGKGFKLAFDKEGKVDLTKGNGNRMAFTVGTSLTDGASALTFDMTLDKITQFADKSNAGATYVKGYKQGSLQSYSIGTTGEIVGNFDNGQNRVLAQLGLTSFKNPEGLERIGGNIFKETKNSGIPVEGVPGANGLGSLIPGALEMSNVDMANEFTNMITTQRGFQANSRVITTTDQMLEELVNLKR